MTLDKLVEIKGKKVVLYLDIIDGDYSHILNNPDLNIIGIMTRYSTAENNFYGLPYLTFSEVIKVGVEVILITTDPIYYEIVSARLKGFCKKNGIDLFTNDGSKVQLDFPEQRRDVSAFYCRKNICKEKIENAETIIFDFLDVLFSYKFLWKEDIDLVRNILLKKSNQNELSIQKKILVERYDMIELLRYAEEKNKKIIVKNNTDFSNKFIEEILNEIGIVNYIIINQIKEKFFEDVLYFAGSDYRGINCEYVRIYTVYEMLLMSRFKEKIQEELDLYARIKLGLFSSRAFNSPFVLAVTGDGRIQVSSNFDIGYLFCAEYITDFMVWFIKEIEDANVDCVLFGARDGYLVQKLYENTKIYTKSVSLPPSIYLWISRMVSINIGIKNSSDIMKIANMYFAGSKCKMLSNRFFLKKDEILKYNERYDDDLQYIMAHEQKIVARSEGVRNRYLKYVNSLSLGKYNKISYFDFAASGTCQLFLQEILNKDLHGYYFYRFDTSDQRKKELNIKSFVEKNISLETNSLFMECVLTAPHATVIDIDEEGNPIFIEESRTTQEIEYSIDMQKAIEKYFQEILEFTDGLEDIIIQKPAMNEFCKYMYDSYTIINNEVFCNYVVKDEFVNLDSQVGKLYVH